MHTPISPKIPVCKQIEASVLSVRYRVATASDQWRLQHPTKGDYSIQPMATTASDQWRRQHPTNNNYSSRPMATTSVQCRLQHLTNNDYSIRPIATTTSDQWRLQHPTMKNTETKQPHGISHAAINEATLNVQNKQSQRCIRRVHQWCVAFCHKTAQ